MRTLSILSLSLLLSTSACLVSGQAHTGGPPPPAPVEEGRPPDRGSSMGFIEGVVADAATHQGLDKAALDFAAGGKSVGSAYTDASGHFRTPEMPPGEYAIRIRREKFDQVQQPSVGVHRGRNEMNFEMVRNRPGL